MSEIHEIGGVRHQIYQRIIFCDVKTPNNNRLIIVWSFNMGWWILVNCIRQSMLKLKTQSIPAS
jgi:hypothetical protein